MKKAIIAIAIIAVAALTTLTVSSKSNVAKPVELTKVNSGDFVKKSFTAPKSDLASID
jgi:hypothetical protein